MKTGTCILLSIVSLVAAVIFISASCDNNNGGVTPTWIGTWINPDYDGSVEGNNWGKMVITHIDGNDYRWAEYDKYDDPLPGIWIIAALTNQWTDSEGNLFIEAMVDTESPDPMYHLFKIHADNKTLETNWSDVDYPTEIDHAVENYGIFYRSE